MIKNVAVIGGKDTGKTTFLALLYAAQMRYADFSDGGFRFYIHPKSIDPISSEYNSMQMGNWPSNKLVKTSREVSFVYGRVDAPPNKLFSFMSKPKEPITTSLNLAVYNLHGPEFELLIKDNKMSYMNQKPRADRLLDSKILVIIIDSTALTKIKKEDRGKPGDHDFEISNAIDNIARKHRSKIYPVIVFTKFDELSPKVLGKLHLPTKPPGKDKAEERQKHAETLLRKFYPLTFNQIKANKFINYDGKQYFYSILRTEESDDGKIIPSLLQTVDAGFVIDCDYKEYINFIEYLEKISKY